MATDRKTAWIHMLLNDIQRLLRQWWKQGWLAIGLAIGSVLFTITSGTAQQALPPPPTVPGLEPLQDLQPVDSTAFPPNDPAFTPNPAPFPDSNSSPVFNPSIAAPPTQYQVVINGDSPYLLEQVRLIEPTASIQQYKGQPVIQAGLFNDEATAQQRVATLTMQGIGATIVSPSGTTASGMSATLNVPPGYQEPFNSMPYLVVVPARATEFAALTEQMVRMGVRADAIQAKTAPRGPHLAIGPFAQQSEADYVSSYLRRSGVDARVYYEQ
ncbi:hypothetical protein ACN4EK_14270 [Pantanalinema rosaneae CENA516]|uniref:hypothetical protein n=1 Tax=Pantanalinema rosaneae TaxID=1620701 RepID=UPI003D6DEC1A